MDRRRNVLFGDGGISAGRTTTIRRAIRRLSVAPLLAMLLAVSACGGGGDSGAASATVSPPPAVVDPAPPGGSAAPPASAQPVAMPNLVGTTLEQATAALNAAGLQLTGAAPVTSPVLPIGSVVSQSPVAGTPITPGEDTYINLSSPLVPYLQSPEQGAFVADTQRVSARVDAVFEVAEVVAEVGGVATPLTFTQQTNACGRATSPCPGYVGDVSFAGSPFGAVEMTVRARDVRGNVYARSFPLVHDNLPEIVVRRPANSSVAVGNLVIDATCTDDSGACTLEVILANDGVVAASGPGGFNGTIDVRRYAGQTLAVTFRVADGDRASTQTATVFVENTTRATTVAEVPGPIVDVSVAGGRMRVLYVIRGPSGVSGDSMFIRDVAAGTDESIPLASRVLSRNAGFLLPNGAIFVTTDLSGSSSTWLGHLWRQGALAALGRAYPGSLGASGNFAIFSDDTILKRLDAATGGVTTIRPDANQGENAITPTGAAVYAASGPRFQLYRDDAGTVTPLTSDTTWEHIYPLTDGTRVVFRKNRPKTSLFNPTDYRVMLLEGGSEIELTAVSTFEARRYTDYAVNNGWVAFTNVGTTPQATRQVFLRSPAGSIVRRTDFSTASSIDNLAGNGDLIAINGGLRYFSDGTRLVPIGSASGKSYLLNGAWYLAIDRTLLAIDTN